MTHTSKFFYKWLPIISVLFLVFQSGFSQQTISVDANSYGQEFIGTGGSCGLYIGHYLSMTEADQLEASRMLYDDLKLNAVKEYVDDVPEVDGALYDKISTFVTNAKIYNPDVQFFLCANNLPDELEEKDGNGKAIKGEYDATIPNIFDKIAEYYFKACEGYFLRGHKVDILELINERGYNDGKATELYDQAATKFRALINDPTYNTNNVPMPLIAGPATWSASSPQVFIDGWKADRPNAWANVDVVTTHGYQNSTEANYQHTFDISEGKPFYQSEQTGKIQKGEATGVDVLGEQFSDGYAPNFVNNAAIAKHMIDFFNGGGNKFFAFLTNTHKYDHNAGLIGTPYGGVPGKTNIYDGFKHLSATQPIGAKRLDKDLTNIDSDYFKTVAFRKPGENLVYVHILNMYGEAKQVSLDFKGNGIKNIKVIRTDEFLAFSEIKNETYATPLGSCIINTTPYSVTTAIVTLEGSSTTTLQPQAITFNALSDKLDTDTDFDLTATASSGLPVSYEILSGPATISGHTVSISGVGTVRIRATQNGDDNYYEALPVEQTFLVKPSGVNIALNKPATASSQLNDYSPDKAVDGNISDNTSRWLTSKNLVYSTDPQWIEIDLQANYLISAFGMYVGNSGYNNPIHEFEFQVWDSNAETWQTVVTETNNFEPIYLKDFSPTVGSKVRLYLPDGPDGFVARLYELEVYGDYDSEVTQLNNIALNKAVTVNYGDGSYTHYSTYAPEGAVDGVKSGDDTKRWLFRYSDHPLPVEMEIDFGANYDITSYSMFEDTSSSYFTSEYSIEYWDGSSWTALVDKSVSGGNEKTTHNVVNEPFDQTITTNKVKIIFKSHTQETATTTNKYIRLYELEFYGSLASTAGIGDSDFEKPIIFPNPTKGDKIWIKSKGRIDTVEVYDLLGVLQEGCSFDTETLDLNDLSHGVYFLRINHQFTFKFVKN